MQVTGNQPAQYVPQTGNPQGAVNQPAANTKSGYTYGDDVFKGQYTMFKPLYNNFDPNVSKYSPFYGRIGGAPANQNPGPAQQNNQGGGIPASLQGNNSGGIPSSLANPPANTAPVVQQQQVPATLPSAPQTPAIPAKTPPTGPALSNIQQILQDEVQRIQTPQKAVEMIANHAMLSRQERTMANDIAWGAKFYATKAAELGEKLSQNRPNMSQGQVQSQLRTIEGYKIKSISLLNDAKKRAINTYNEALKSTLMYNHFFAGNGQYATTINPNDRLFVESEIDKTWARWNGGFDKEWQGQAAHADEAPTVIDKAAREVAIALDKADKFSGVAK